MEVLRVKGLTTDWESEKEELVRTNYWLSSIQVDKFESWDEANGPPDMILVPIKLPKDSYMMSLKARS